MTFWMAKYFVWPFSINEQLL